MLCFLRVGSRTRGVRVAYGWFTPESGFIDPFEELFPERCVDHTIDEKVGRRIDGHEYQRDESG